MPAWGDFDVRVRDLGIVLEDSAGTCECEAGLKVPEGVAVEVGACDCISVERWEDTRRPYGWSVCTS